MCPAHAVSIFQHGLGFWLSLTPMVYTINVNRACPGAKSYSAFMSKSFLLCLHDFWEEKAEKHSEKERMSIANPYSNDRIISLH